MSVALVAVARAARPSRRVTCVRVAQGHLAPTPPAPPPDAEVIAPPEEPVTEADFDAGLVLAEADWSTPALPFEDLALWQPTEVMAALVVEAEVEEEVAEVVPAGLEAEVEPDAMPEPEPEPAAPPAPTATAAPAFAPPAPAPAGAPAPAAPPAPAPAGAPAPWAPPEPAAPPALSEPAAAPPSDPWGWAEPWAFEIPAAGAESGRARAPARHPRRRTSGQRRRGGTHPVISLAVIVLAVAVSAWIAIPRSSSAAPRPKETADVSYLPHPSAYALGTIPTAYLHDYWRAADEYGLDWTKLAAVGQIESDQGRSETPGVAEGTNPAGAAGPAQFLGSTWARYGVDADGRGTISPYDPADAITAMAAYLKASGAPEDWRAALFTYNHSTAYVDAVLALSRRYLGS